MGGGAGGIREGGGRAGHPRHAGRPPELGGVMVTPCRVGRKHALSLATVPLTVTVLLVAVLDGNCAVAKVLTVHDIDSNVRGGKGSVIHKGKATRGVGGVFSSHVRSFSEITWRRGGGVSEV